MAVHVAIRAMLAEGNGRIAVGRAEEVAALVLAQPRLFAQLMECLWDDDPGVVNRAAHALERVTRDRQRQPIAQLNRWKSSLLGLMREAAENKLRWHLALIVPRMTLTAAEGDRVAELLTGWANDSESADRSSSIVRTMALQGLFELARESPPLRPAVEDLLRVHERTGTPAMRARSRLLLASFEERRGAESDESIQRGHRRNGSEKGDLKKSNQI